MTTEHLGNNFGDQRNFAIEFALYQDPDLGQVSDCAESASWGAFRVWVDGRNLCEHQVGDSTENAVHWYLLPFFEWLVMNWDALLHEERLPLGSHGINARSAYYDTLRLVLGNIDSKSEMKSMEWQRWWKRHALRACRFGGVFPDIFIRRLRDTIELSWGDQPLPGLPDDFYFTVPQGVVCLPVTVFADTLQDALHGAVAALKKARAQHSVRVEDFCLLVEEIKNKDPIVQTAWFVEAEQRDQRSLRIVDFVYDYARKVSRDVADAMFINQVGKGYVETFSPAALMFGSANPQISEGDISNIADVLVHSFNGVGDSDELRPFVRHEALSPNRPPFQEAYDLALDLLEDLRLPNATDSFIDIEDIVSTLKIRVIRKDFAESKVRGLAIAGPTARPTIVINQSHPANRSFGGERFAIAHELCHVLYDREYGRGVSLASGPWAPEALERRANAFAAMVLMPPEIIDRAIAESREPTESLNGIKEIAKMMNTSVRATIEHLANVGKITDPDRDLLLNEWDSRIF